MVTFSKISRKTGASGSCCNLSYSGGGDQEDCSSKPAWTNSLRDPISKKKISQKRAGGVAQGVGPEFKPQYRKKKKKEEELLVI
jgi:hypothetical protein